MQKIACIFSFKMSSWVSCQKIVFNLHKAYQLNKNLELLNFNYSVDQTTDEILKTAQDVFDKKPDVILILDHKPHPLPLLQTLCALYKTEVKKPRLIFHIFGDFTLYYSHWEKLAKLVDEYQVDFIVASDRQKDLIDKFLAPHLTSHVCPFPVAKDEFHYSKAVRKLQRKEWGLSEEDMVFCFTGRLSNQKRIHTLIRAFAEFLEKTKSENAYLYIYGNPDHIGDQFLGKWEVENEYFRKFNKIYRSFPKPIQEKIQFKGSVPNKELKAVYQGADMLINLSVHNDEDYGMSVAEAQCSGLPAILTDWGGLASFHHPERPEYTRFIPVKIGIKSKLIHYEFVVSEIEKAFKKGHFKNREEISDRALKRFSVEAASDIVSTILATEPEPFKGFSAFFDKIFRRYMLGQGLYMTPNKKISNLYREIYSSYVRNN